MIDESKEVLYFVAEKSYEVTVLANGTYDTSEEDDDDGD